MDTKKAFGIFFTLLGTSIMMISVYAMLSDTFVLADIEIGSLEAIIPAILGIIFFSAGVKFLR
ncbi:MAG: hypothetical protein ACLFUB_02135 [Cyclobacteriaceae bacterium]